MNRMSKIKKRTKSGNATSPKQRSKSIDTYGRKPKYNTSKPKKY